MEPRFRKWITVLAVLIAIGLIDEARAERCWLIGCDGLVGFLKVLPDNPSSGDKPAKKLFGTEKPPAIGEVVPIERFAYLRPTESRPEWDSKEDPAELANGADVLAPGTLVRIIRYDSDGRFILVQVVESRGDFLNYPSDIHEAI